jgi:hypothetical protein
MLAKLLLRRMASWYPSVARSKAPVGEAPADDAVKDGVLTDGVCDKRRRDGLWREGERVFTRCHIKIRESKWLYGGVLVGL